MNAADLVAAFAERGSAEAIVFRRRSMTYAALRDRWIVARARLEAANVGPGDVVLLQGDFTPDSVATFWALAERRAIIVPMTDAVTDPERHAAAARAELRFRFDDDEACIDRLGPRAGHALFDELRRRDHPGLVILTSGSTGEPKAAVHDLAPLIAGHAAAQRAYRAVTFLLYDHIGGVNTMLRMLATGSCMVTVESRDPDAVLAAVERHGVELLPVSPTFLNLALLGGAFDRHDVSSLKVVSYGTEPMPESTLARLRERLPGVRLVQLYGLSEIGILPSRTRPDDSRWIELGGGDAEVRVVDGLLEVRAETAMLGYLDAPSPFTADGWLRTGDAVDVDGPWLRVRGRASDLINVGGEKVFPAEVESVLLELENVDDACVRGEASPIVGQMVCARISVSSDVDPRAFRNYVRAWCAERLDPFKVPVKIELTREPLHSARFKRVRQPTPAS